MEKELFEVLQALVGINSVNPTLPGGASESSITDWIFSYFQNIGVEVIRIRVDEGRDNVVAIIPGRDRTKPLLLNAHVDTVGVELMSDPFSLRREGDRLFGRGAYDMKGSAAVMMLIGKRFSNERPAMDLILTFVVDEEVGSLGMERLVSDYLSTIPFLPVGGIFMEPTEGNIGIAHKGYETFELVVHGTAAHGSRPEQGVDAILPISAGLIAIEKIQNSLDAKPGHALLGRANIHTGTISGGSALNVIPAECRLTWERRTLPGENREAIRLEYEQIKEAVSRLPGRHRVSGGPLYHRPASEIPEEADVVRRLKDLAPAAQTIGLSFWADAAIGNAAGIHSVLYGPIGHGAHAVDEWVSLNSLIEIYRVLERFGMEGW
jgi:acetylornithine deacetylase